MRQQINRTYKAVPTDVPLLVDPDPDSAQVDVIPVGTTIEVTERDHHWVKAKGKGGKEGWAAATMMTRIMDKPAPDLEFYSNGYKIVDGKYRNFFGINNVGLAEFTGEVNLRLFSNGDLLLAQTYTCKNDPINSPGGRNHHEDTNVEVTHFEFETKDGSYKGVTKGFLARHS